MNLLKRYAVPACLCDDVLMLAACSSTKDERRVADAAHRIQARARTCSRRGRRASARRVVTCSRRSRSATPCMPRARTARSRRSMRKPVKDIWRIKLDDDLSAGVGSDGTLTAVGGLKGDVYVLGAGRQAIVDRQGAGRNHLAAAGRQRPRGGAHGRWSDHRVQRANRRAEVGSIATARCRSTCACRSGMTFAGDAAVLAGFPGGAFAAINLQTGDNYWQTPVSYPKGVTEVERINDVTGPPTLRRRGNLRGDVPGSALAASTRTPAARCGKRRFRARAVSRRMTVTVVAADDWSVVSAFDVSRRRAALEERQAEESRSQRPVSFWVMPRCLVTTRVSCISCRATTAVRGPCEDRWQRDYRGAGAGRRNAGRADARRRPVRLPSALNRAGYRQSSVVKRAGRLRRPHRVFVV